MNEQEQNLASGKNLSMPYVDEFLKRYEVRRLEHLFFERLSLLIIAGLGLVTAFAWDDLFKTIFVKLFGSLNVIADKLLYAFLLTIITVTITIILAKIFKMKMK